MTGGVRGKKFPRVTLGCLARLHIISAPSACCSAILLVVICSDNDEKDVENDNVVCCW